MCSTQGCRRWAKQLTVMSLNSDCKQSIVSLGRSQIVVVVKDDTVRSRLMKKSELTLQKTIDICRAAEVSSSQVSTLKSSETNGTIFSLINSAHNALNL